MTLQLALARLRYNGGSIIRGTPMKVLSSQKIITHGTVAPLLHNLFHQKTCQFHRVSFWRVNDRSTNYSCSSATENESSIQTEKNEEALLINQQQKLSQEEPTQGDQTQQAHHKEPKQRYRITVQYDGYSFSGWQRQDKQENTKTVQQLLERALSSFAQSLCKKKDVYITAHTSSRTDAGVHAIMSTAHFDLKLSQAKNASMFPSEETVLKGLNTHLTKAHLSVTSVRKVDSSYFARYAAKKRIYVYKIVLVPNEHINVSLPLLQRYAWFLNVAEFVKRNSNKLKSDRQLAGASSEEQTTTTRPEMTLDLDRMKQVAAFMSGKELDWQALSTPGDVSRNRGKPINTIRRIDSIDIVHQKATPQSSLHTFTSDPFSFFNPSYDSITVTITAQSFLYHQIRYMMHAMVSVSSGVSSLEDIEQLFREAKPPSDKLGLAPPHGLFLAAVLDQYSHSIH